MIKSIISLKKKSLNTENWEAVFSLQFFFQSLFFFSYGELFKMFVLSKIQRQRQANKLCALYLS